MAEKTATENLSIPRIMGNQPLLRQQFNAALDQIDLAALPKNHAKSKAHFELWQKNTVYKKQDVVRTPTCPSWGFYMCTVSGTSGVDEPQGYGEGDILTDGTCMWKLKLFGGQGSVINSGVSLWRSNVDYKIDELVLYNCLMYRCIAVHTSGLNFEKAKWGLINVGYLPDWELNAGYAENMLVIQSGTLYRCLTYHTSSDFAADKQAGKWETLLICGAIIKNWQALEAYERDETVRYGAYLYRAKAAHTAGASFTAANWERLESGYLPDWQAGAKYESMMAIVYDDVIYRCKTAHTSTTFTADIANWAQVAGGGLSVYQQNKIYYAGQVVLRNGLLYTKK